MACWLFIDDKCENIDRKINRFRKVFDIDGGFDLNVNPIKLTETKSLILWSWNNLGEYPDISHHHFENKKIHVVIDGFISGFGKFGEATDSQRENAKKLTQLYTQKKEFIQELNGSFCIIIYNLNTDRVLLINDRTSTRPIWYNKEEKSFYAANFPSTIATIKKSDPKLSEIGLWSFLATSRHSGEIGLFDGIYNLPSGTALSLNSDLDLKRTAWFNLKYKPNYDLSVEQWGEKIAAELKISAQNIKKQYQDITLFLSGGMDSRVAAGAFGKTINSLTLTTRDNMNSKLSERVSKACQMNHETVYRDNYWYLNSFKEASLIGSGNFKISHAHFTSLFRRDQKYFKGAFTHGDLLENFNKHYFKNVNDKLNPETFVHRFNQIYSYSVNDFNRFENLFLNDYGKKIRLQWEEFVTSEFEKLNSVSGNQEDVLDAYFRWQNNTVCPTYLMLENIRPFAGLVNLMFNNHLLEILLSIPQEIRVQGELHNQILKNLNPKLLKIPNSNFWLPPSTPTFITDTVKKIRPVIGKYRRLLKNRNPKKPFVYTEGSWDMLHERYRKDNKHNELIQSIIFDKDFIEKNKFNKEYIDCIYREFMRGDLSKTVEIELLFSLGLLMKQFK